MEEQSMTMTSCHPVLPLSDLFPNTKRRRTSEEVGDEEDHPDVTTAVTTAASASAATDQQREGSGTAEPSAINNPSAEEVDFVVDDEREGGRYHPSTPLDIEPCGVRQMREHVSYLRSELAELIRRKEIEIRHAESRIESLRTKQRSSNDRRRRCAVEGCTNISMREGVCCRHGAVKVHPLCSFEGCTRKAQRRGVCFRHGAKPMMCRVEGCKNQVKKGGMCRRHLSGERKRKGPRPKEKEENTKRVRKKEAQFVTVADGPDDEGGTANGEGACEKRVEGEGRGAKTQSKGQRDSEGRLGEERRPASTPASDKFDGNVAEVPEEDDGGRDSVANSVQRTGSLSTRDIIEQLEEDVDAGVNSIRGAGPLDACGKSKGGP